MAKKVDLTGKRFGRLVVVGIVKRDSNGRAYWNCKCDCGNEVVVRHDSLQCGHAKSCGCFKIGETSACYKHGKRNTRLFRIWSLMRTRCYNSHNKLYKDYGGRGISICDEWQDFQTFYDWAMTNSYAVDLTIDRINVNGNYEPSNCRWVTMAEQCNNKRNNVCYFVNGETLNTSQIAKKYGITYGALKARLARGWSIDKAITAPLRVHHSAI